MFESCLLNDLRQVLPNCFQSWNQMAINYCPYTALCRLQDCLKPKLLPWGSHWYPSWVSGCQVRSSTKSKASFIWLPYVLSSFLRRWLRRWVSKISAPAAALCDHVDVVNQAEWCHVAMAFSGRSQNASKKSVGDYGRAGMDGAFHLCKNCLNKILKF